MNDEELKIKTKQSLVTKISISYFVFIVFLSVSLVVCYKYDCIISLFGFSFANFSNHSIRFRVDVTSNSNDNDINRKIKFSSVD